MKDTGDTNRRRRVEPDGDIPPPEERPFPEQGPVAVDRPQGTPGAGMVELAEGGAPPAHALMVDLDLVAVDRGEDPPAGALRHRAARRTGRVPPPLLLGETTHPSSMRRFTQSWTVLRGVSVASAISVTVKEPASSVTWRISRRYCFLRSRTLDMPALDIQKVADHGAGGLGGTCTLPDEREVPGEIRLHGDGVERSFDDKGVDFRTISVPTPASGMMR